MNECTVQLCLKSRSESNFPIAFDTKIKINTHTHTHALFICLNAFAPKKKASFIPGALLQYLSKSWVLLSDKKKMTHTICMHAYTHIFPYQWQRLNLARLVSALCLLLFIWYDKHLYDRYTALDIIKMKTVCFSLCGFFFVCMYAMLESVYACSHVTLFVHGCVFMCDICFCLSVCYWFTE